MNADLEAVKAMEQENNTEEIRKATQKTTQKTTQKQHSNNKRKLSNSEQIILKNISINPFITSNELSKIVGITADNIRVNISKLKAKGLLERIGADKSGYWKVIK
jgi:predicted HTH transcriptional regulator